MLFIDLYFYSFNFLLIYVRLKSNTLREKCPYSKLFCSVFARIRTKFGEILRISPYLV